jgi:glutamyl/glutaminyl-tRNA synthetase
MLMAVRTRFAPSPTGYLHIGGVRTAIFNWLFAKRHGGSFILRIDDTDQERHREEALQPILHGFRWLGMQWDEGPEVGGPYGPYFQSQRLDKYRVATARLLESGHAYPCFCSTAELDAERAAAKSAKIAHRYSGKCRRLSTAQREKMLSEGRPNTIRFAVPEDRNVAFNDLILGSVEQETREIGDRVIVRADGHPLYNFASAVDDIDMQISHVIRAQEHLANTYFQWLVFEALGETLPAFAHVPYVALPGSKEKISKRKLDEYMSEQNKGRFPWVDVIREKFSALGWDPKLIPNPVTVMCYEELGYLPDAMVNGLARIGWSLDDKQEKISRAELLASFSLDRVNAAPASFDPGKLYWLQGETMRELPIEARVDGVIPQLQKAKLLGASVDDAARERIRRVVEALGDRLKVFSDIVPYGSFFFADDVQYDLDAVKKTLRKDNVFGLLTKLRTVFAETDPFDVPTIELRVREFSDADGIKASAIIHPMRVALSGRSVGPGVFELAAILGRQACMRRIDQTLTMLRATANGHN